MKIKKTLKTIVATLSILLFAMPSFAYNIDDGGGTDAGFGLITIFFQKYINFMTGPFAHMAIAATMIMGVIVWAVSPKEGMMGIVSRVVIAAIVCLNVGTWMGMFASSI